MARAINAGAATVRIFADTDPLQRGLKRAQRQLKAFSASVTQLGKTLLKTKKWQSLTVVGCTALSV